MKYEYAGLELRYIVLAVSGLVVFIMLFLGFFIKVASIDPLVHPLTVSSISLIIIFLPFGLADFAEVKRKEEAERRLPDFLRDLAGHTNFGTPMSEAILRSAEVNYGPLSEEVNQIAGMIRLGIPVETALDDFGKRLKSETIIRVGKIIKKASESGSNTSDVISLISSFTTQTYLMRESRFADMRSYSTTMAVSFGVFLFVIIMLDLFFFPQIAGQSLGGSGATLNIKSSSFGLIERIFSAGIIIQSVASGLISGVFRDGRLVSGSLVSGILVFISMVVLLIVGVM
ncbi:type II secretion system F family protein [Cuniculiplasma sp. SKW3]|uniref:type II secretion system F family protein n=1 Tax=unclassified Cuniculiplasma TaxID=2619706 RepID=UPI003FCF56E0